MGSRLYGVQNCVIEFRLHSATAYPDPFNDLDLDVIFTEPDGQERRVPAFWAGEQAWRVRYTSSLPGAHRYHTECSDATNPDLHGVEGSVEVAPYEGTNPLLRHGALQVVDRHHFEHLDGTPFFWLGDTWWTGLSKRIGWPDEFQLLTADRVGKGFSVVQIVAGLYPDMPPFDPRGANEAGFPWDEGFERVNPAYFDMADLRIQCLLLSGLVPCIVGCWGYYIDFAGVEAMKKHWRYLLARYGAYPVIWCMAGEATMLYYLSPAKQDEQARERATAAARAGWTEVARYLRSIDPFHRPITLHPSSTARDTVDDPSVMDFDMLQTGHGGWDSMANTVRRIGESRAAAPKMPTVVGEVCYEGILGKSWEDVQRFAFWASVLSGASGFTYGANGLWQLNRLGEPFGPSPHGKSWGGPAWQDACRLPGSTQVGIGRRLFERYEWWQFEAHPEWVEPHASPDDFRKPYAAGIPGKVRIIFLPASWSSAVVKALEDGTSYRARHLNPRTGEQVELGEVQPDADGNWTPPPPLIIEDVVLVLEAK